MWLPSGDDWYEWHTGTLLKGSQSIERTFSLGEYPTYVKAGSILPLYDKVTNLKNNDESVIVKVFSGKEGFFEMYEDNGNDKDYAIHNAKTQLMSERTGNVLNVKVCARQGNYLDMHSKRNFKVKVIASPVPDSVMVNGLPIDFRYNGND